MRVGTEVEVAIGHRLMDYTGPCQHLHGHNYRVIVEYDEMVNLPIPERGMFIDFKELRRVLNEILEPFDHAMMLRYDDPWLSFLQPTGTRLVPVKWNPTAENFAHWIKKQLRLSLGENKKLVVRVYETTKSYAEV